jgi:hypothetical protein
MGIFYHIDNKRVKNWSFQSIFEVNHARQEAMQAM